MPLGGVGTTSDSYIYPTLINGLLGTRFKVINGYAGTKDIHLALERQAAHVQCDKDGDQNRIASRLSDVLQLLPELADGDADNCLHLAGSEMRWEDCHAPAPP